jgi:hypothetical protein
MSDMLAARIGEEAIAIKYRLDHGRAPCRVALPEDFVKVANQKILDAIDMRCSPLSLLRTAPGIGEELCRETGAAAIPCRPNGLVPFISRDR